MSAASGTYELNRAPRPASGADRERSLTARDGNLAPGAVVMDLPALRLGISAETLVGIDGAGVAHERKHRQVIVRIGIGVAASQVEPFAFGNGIDRNGFAFAMQHFADEVTGIHTVDVFGNGAQRTG